MEAFYLVFEPTELSAAGRNTTRNVTMEEWGFLSAGQYLIHHRDGKFQIPPDLVVKYQRIDIVNVIFSPIWRRSIVEHDAETGNHGVSCSHHRRLIGLPLNAVECGKTLSECYGIEFPQEPGAEDHGSTAR